MMAVYCLLPTVEEHITVLCKSKDTDKDLFMSWRENV